MTRTRAKEELRHLYLPDFCTPRAVLAVMLIVELTAVMLTLARYEQGAALWTGLAQTSLFLVWIGLVSAACLCGARRWIETLPLQAGSALTLALMACVVAVISEAAWWLGRSEFLGAGSFTDLFPQAHGPFVLRNVGIALIITGLALRYFYVAHQWRRNVEIQARARVHALQARIRPHFLYNSMNTIAALTRSDPASAEAAVQDLADLFRANLNEKRTEIPLKEELEVARIYQRIEQLRLGDRLRVAWLVQDLPMRALVPSLLVQPLLENAVGHGIEPLTGGGEVIIEGSEDNGMIVLSVRNPLALDAADEQRPSSRVGHGLALANIRERLKLMYGERSHFEAGREGDEFVVRLRFPHVEAATGTLL